MASISSHAADRPGALRSRSCSSNSGVRHATTKSAAAPSRIYWTRSQLCPQPGRPAASPFLRTGVLVSLSLVVLGDCGKRNGENHSRTHHLRIPGSLLTFCLCDSRKCTYVMEGKLWNVHGRVLGILNRNVEHTCQGRHFMPSIQMRPPLVIGEEC